MKKKKQWMEPKSIRFEPKKLALAKKKGVINQLPDLCRKQLDELIK